MAIGDILSVSIDGSGWTTTIGISGLASGGSYAMGFGSNNSITGTALPKLKFTITSSGFDDNTNPIQVTRYVYGTTGVRQPYPNNNLKQEFISGINVYCTLSLSDYIYQKDINIKADISGGLYTYSSTPNNQITGISVTNNSILQYPSVIANWSWPGYELITGNTFKIRCLAYQHFGESGRPVKAVKFTVNDTSGNYLSGIQTQLTTDNIDFYTTIPEYIHTFTASGNLVQGSIISGNFVAYPWVGDLTSIIDTSKNIGTPYPHAVPSTIIYVNDFSGTYGTTIAIVDPTNGFVTGQAIDITGFNPLNPPRAYLTICSGARAIFNYNNTNRARGDVGAGIIYLKSGDHSFVGASSTYGTTPNTYITIKPFSGENKNTVRITNSAGNNDITDRIKIEDVSISGSVGSVNIWFSNITALWFNNCYFYVTGTSTIGGTTNLFLTNNNIGLLRQGIRSFSVNATSPLIVRNNIINDLSGIIYVYNFIGNTIYYTGTTITNNIAGQTAPFSVIPIFAFNKHYRSSLSNSNTWDFVSTYNANNLTTGISGMAIISNLYENINPSNLTALSIFSSASDSGRAYNALLWNNNFLGKNNMFYNDQGTLPVYKDHISVKNNLFSNLNIKTDTFGTANGNRTGNWTCMHGVGWEGNIFAEISGVGSATNFPLIFPGLHSIMNTNVADTGYFKFYDDGSMVGQIMQSGTGNYKLNSDSPAINIIKKQLLPVDIELFSRTSTSDAAGMYSASYNSVVVTTISGKLNIQNVVLRPYSDISTGLWGISPLYSKINEISPDDSTYINSSDNPSSDTCEIKLTPTGHPQSYDNHKIRYRYQKSNVPETVDLTVSLYQGTGLIASNIHNGIDTSWSIGSFILTTGQAATITDYTDLRLKFIANRV